MNKTCNTLSEPCGRKKLAIIVTICVTIIIGYAKLKCTTHFQNTRSDPLLNKIGIGNLTGWSLTHVAFYVLLGYLFPKDFKLLMMLGVLWEITEQYVLSVIDWGKSNCTDDFWYGEFSDIFMNAIGFWLGYQANKYKLG